jgi:hypothetical protein
MDPVEVLEIEVGLPMTPKAVEKRILAPLRERLEQEGVGELMEFEEEEPLPAGRYHFGVLAINPGRCREIVKEVLAPFKRLEELVEG